MNCKFPLKSPTTKASRFAVHHVKQCGIVKLGSPNQSFSSLSCAAKRSPRRSAKCLHSSIETYHRNDIPPWPEDGAASALTNEKLNEL